MMGVYIKGMEMPTSCRECHLEMNCDGCEGWECFCLPLQKEIGYWDHLLTDKRRDDCPLVPVPEHGDLIDREKIAYFKDDSNLLDFDYAYRSQINSMPAIIPAEEEQT